MTIFEASGTLGRENSKTNTVLEFDVPTGIKVLKISYSYSPKSPKDKDTCIREITECFEKYEGAAPHNPEDYLPVKNLLTLSLDCCGEYRGAAHRQADRQEHIISQDYASYGFIKGKIKAGKWDAVLNAHNISCDITYRLKVEGDEE